MTGKVNSDVDPLGATLNKCILTHSKLCLATATQNLKWVGITHICLIWDQLFASV